ncbi:long-chain fatty acid--CoA ligase [soil metagenome]
MQRDWLKHYPPGVPETIDASAYESLVALMDEAFERHAKLAAYKFMGSSYSFRDVDEMATAFAAYLQAQGLVKGDRVALMMPNVPQYPVAVAGVLLAGLVVVNVNPLYTPRELEHQLRDSGASAIVIFENFAHVLQKCLGSLPILASASISNVGSKTSRRIIVTGAGDLLGLLKGSIVNLVVRRVKKLVPAYELPGSVRFNRAVATGRSSSFARPSIGREDIAVIQYTGGTTGVSKGAVLLHRNLVANVLQSQKWNEPAFRAEPGTLAQPIRPEDNNVVCALPLYHIFAFTVNMMLSLRQGSCTILIPNARDIKAVLKELKRHRFHTFPAVNTLFNALTNHPDFDSVDWSHLKLSVGGGSSVQQATAKVWLARTGCAICEGYGLSETSPSAACNPTDSKAYTGTIGMPLPSTDFKLIDDAGKEVAPGAYGEIAIKGPQVMAGYWNRPEDTESVMTADGFLRTGDIGAVDERGYFRIVDRKKDMVLVSGFNVYPNEIEDVVSQMPGVLECAVVGVPDEKTGEAVRLVIVKRDATLTESAVRAYCVDNLTGYKRPRVIEFRDTLPKTPVGKILRRELRQPVKQPA